MAMVPYSTTEERLVYGLPCKKKPGVMKLSPSLCVLFGVVPNGTKTEYEFE